MSYYSPCLGRLAKFALKKIGDGPVIIYWVYLAVNIEARFCTFSIPCQDSGKDRDKFQFW